MSTYDIFKKRRELLVKNVGHPIVLFAGLEDSQHRFLQDSTFYYFTGIEEPGVACVLLPDGPAKLFVSTFKRSRAQWMGSALEPSQETAQRYGFDEAAALGEPCEGYSVDFFGSPAQWQTLVQSLLFIVDSGFKIGVVQRNLVSHRLMGGLPVVAEAAFDCSDVIATMRRAKEKDEITALFKAGEITLMAHEAAVMALEVGATEAKVRASIDYIFAQEGAMPAFPSIVACGKNSTILHYDKSGAEVILGKGDLIIVDIGARVDHYCADVTRTYPVSGVFSKRQKEVYNAVLKAQEEVAFLAKPGVFLRNDEEPSNSLYHCAQEVLKFYGLADYFTHGIGHFLGLDVHDVGQVSEPLRPGDVITIEPGVYLPEEGFGVRIEDDFWLIEDGVMCLTEHLPKAADEIEEWIKTIRK